MGRDHGRAMEDVDRLLVDDDVDVITHEAMRHAVADGVDVDERVVRDPSAQALLASRQ